MDELISSDAHISVPEGPVPVVAYIGGERVIIGEGHIDPETGLFCSVLDIDDPTAKAVYDSLVDMENFKLSVRISEVECYKEGP